MSEKIDIEFAASVRGERRITVPKEVGKAYNINEGDLVTVKIVKVIRQ